MEEKVATIIRNGWQSCAGIGGNFHRNKQLNKHIGNDSCRLDCQDLRKAKSGDPLLAFWIVVLSNFFLSLF